MTEDTTAVAINTVYQAKVDTVHDARVSVVAQPTGDASRLAIASGCNRACVDTVRNLPDRMIAVAAASDAACIFAGSIDFGLVHAVHDDNLLLIVLTSTCDAASTQGASNRATLVEDKVLDNRTFTTTIRVATKGAEEALHLTVGTIDNHVLDAEALTIERTIVLLAVGWTNRPVQVLDVLEVDVVHQLTIRVEVAIGNQVRNPFHIARIAKHVEAIRILLRSFEVFRAIVVHRTDTVHVSVVVGESRRRPCKPHEAEDGKRRNLSHLRLFFKLINIIYYNYIMYVVSFCQKSTSFLHVCATKIQLFAET